MPALLIETNNLPTISEFYDGKSIFFTGASGLIGSVLLEILLRCCPGIKFIYILLRKKKSMQPDHRKEQIFNKKIFEKLKKETPRVLKKVRVISGDVSLPNLGMSEDNMLLLFEEISIVFHCAAVISFARPLEFLLTNNVLGLSSIIEICRNMRKFEALVYCSTVYGNANQHKFPIKEEIYRLPFPAEQFLDALKNEDRQKLKELISYCKPDWPNFYTFSKCLAENVITDTASDLTVAIIRPSVVFSTWKHPISGYMEENTGIAILGLAIARGFIKVINGDSNCSADVVPSDIVANCHILAAWMVGTKRCKSPLVLNCTANESLRVKLLEFVQAMVKLGQEFPLPESFRQTKKPMIVANKYIYHLILFYHHYIPAIFLDGLLRTLKKKSRLYSFYRFLDSVTRSLNFFLVHSLVFERDNLEYVQKFSQAEDKKDLNSDFTDATFRGLTLSLPKGSPFYDWKIDNKSQLERQKMKNKQEMQIKCIQVLFSVTGFLLIYIAFSCTIN